jgi:hypothetical protein
MKLPASYLGPGLAKSGAGKFWGWQVPALASSGPGKFRPGQDTEARKIPGLARYRGWQDIGAALRVVPAAAMKTIVHPGWPRHLTISRERCATETREPLPVN